MGHVQLPDVSIFWNLSPPHPYLRGLINNRKLVSIPHNRGFKINIGRYMGTYSPQDQLIPRKMYTYFLIPISEYSLKLTLSTLIYINLPWILNFLDMLSGKVHTKDKLDSWVKSVELFYNISEKKPQAKFSGLFHYLQYEWNYIKCVSDHPVDTFATLSRALYISFKPVIFGVKQFQEDLLQIT